ncbi:MAG: hypothetical protein EOP58_00740 [Sphingomonadales bacterium]|nr:MAG: hypothetical protein EOP58_00740 [Sphingomonadales bacterium]
MIRYLALLGVFAVCFAAATCAFWPIFEPHKEEGDVQTLSVLCLGYCSMVLCLPAALGLSTALGLL